MFETLFRLVEQSHVLDRDRSLIGKGLDQRDLLVGECAGFRAPKCERADRAVLAHKGDTQNRAEPVFLLIHARFRVFGIKQRNDVGVMDRCSLDRRAADNQATSQRQTVTLLKVLHRSETSGEAEFVPFEQKDSGLRGIA